MNWLGIDINVENMNEILWNVKLNIQQFGNMVFLYENPVKIPLILNDTLKKIEVVLDKYTGEIVDCNLICII